MRRAVIIGGVVGALMVGAGVGCRAAERGAPGAATDVVEAKPEGNGRPTDEDQGVPGYLTDPALIEVGADGGAGAVLISAPDGAVKPVPGTAGRVRIEIWSVPRAAVDALKEAALAGEPQSIAGATRLASLIATATGAFTATVPCGADCFLVFSTEPLAGGTIAVPKAADASQVRQAGHDLTTGAGTFALDLEAFAALLLKLTKAFGPSKARCTVSFPEHCYTRNASGSVAIKVASRRGDGVEQCRAVAETLAVQCAYRPDTVLSAVYDGADGGAPVTHAVTVPAAARCRVTLPAACPASPETPLAFDDDANSATLLPTQCAVRAGILARYCGFEAGLEVTTAFVPVAGEPVTTRAVAPAGPPADCEARGGIVRGGGCEDGVGLFVCTQPYNSPLIGAIGLAAREGLGCYARGFERTHHGFVLFAKPGEGRVALRRFTRTLANGLRRETVARGDAAPAPEWVADEVLGYAMVANDGDERLVGLYRCRFASDPSIDTLMASANCLGHAVNPQPVLEAWGFAPR